MAAQNLTQKFDTEATGNTRSRGYALTIFSMEELETFKEMPAQYKCWGLECCPTTGRMHWQSYIYFKNARWWSAIKEALPTTHIERAKGNAEQNRKYCSKTAMEDGTFREEGDMPQQGKITADDLRHMTHEEIIDRNARCHRAYITASEILKSKMTVSDWKKGKDVKVYYYYGVSGCGKSTKAADHILETYGDVKICIGSYVNNFYILNDTEAEILIMDDWRDSDMKPSEFVKMIDYRVQQMNVKGGHILNKFKAIYITTVRPIHKIYKKMRRRDEHMEQWTRRMTIEHLCIDECDCDEEDDDSDVEIDLSGFVQ